MAAHDSEFPGARSIRTGDTSGIGQRLSVRYTSTTAVPPNRGNRQQALKAPWQLPKQIEQDPPPRRLRETGWGEVNSLIEYLSRLFADLKEESGQTMAEYAVVLGVITIAVVVTLGLLSTKISAVLNSVIAAM
jgi:Flp pilus assembly pilin Flp